MSFKFSIFVPDNFDVLVHPVSIYSFLISLAGTQIVPYSVATLYWPIFFPSPRSLLRNMASIVICRKCPHCSETETDSDLPSDLNGLPSHFCVRYRTDNMWKNGFLIHCICNFFVFCYLSSINVICFSPKMPVLSKYMSSKERNIRKR